MKNSFFLFIDIGKDRFQGLNRAIALFPLSHLKGHSLWLPYPLIIDMTRALIIAERRNLRRDFVNEIKKRFELTLPDDDSPKLPLREEWEDYNGQQVVRHYDPGSCFQMRLDYTDDHYRHMKKVYFRNSGVLCEWTYTQQPLIHFYSDPRFESLLLKAGFVPPASQMHLPLQA